MFQSVNQVALTSATEMLIMGELEQEEWADVQEFLNEDVIGWFQPALDPVCCDHDVDSMVEHVMYCTKCGQVRQVEFR